MLIPTFSPEQQAFFRSIFGAAALNSVENDPARFCELDIADGNQSCTHPSWLYVPEGWNGHQWWMAATPYPSAARENPNVWCSHDGDEWITPPGGSNPVMQPGVINGHNYTTFSDPCLGILHTSVAGVGDAGDMVLVGRPMYPSQEGIYFKTSKDGATWSDYVEMMYAARPGDTGYALLSPSWIQEDDGTFTLWICTGTGMTKQTSADMRNWSAPVACTFQHSLVNEVWHATVKKRDGIYYGGITSRSYKPSWVSSTDGVNFTGRDGALSIIPQQTLGLPNGPAAYDKLGQYRFDMIPSPSKPGAWDLIVPQISSQRWDDPNASAANVFQASHRLQIFRGVDLSCGFTHVSREGSASISLSATDQYVQLTGFNDNVSAENWDSINSRFPPSAGFYRISGAAMFSGGGSGAMGHVALFKNGSFLTTLGAGYLPVSGQPVIGGSFEIFLNGSDYLTLAAKVNNTPQGTNWSVSGSSNTRFQAVKLPQL